MAEEDKEVPQELISSSSSSAAATTGSRWSFLHPDIASNIIPRLDPPSFVRFPSVCNSWRSSGRQHCLRRHPLPQTPWLLLPTGSYGRDVISQKFYSPTELKKYQIHVHLLGEKKYRACHRIIGSSNGSGLLIYVDDISTVNAVNPLTGARVPLPCISAFPDIHTFYSLAPLHLTTTTKAIVVSHDQHHTTVATCFHSPFLNGDGIAFAKSGDASWTVPIAPTHGKFHDFISHKGKIYVIYQRGELAIFDLDRPSDEPAIRQFKLLKHLIFFKDVHLAESPNGNDLFLVVGGPKKGEWKQTKFFVFVLDEEKWDWSTVRSLPDSLSMFVGDRIAFALDVNRCHGLESNCIYFFRNSEYPGLWVFDLQGRKIKRLLDHTDGLLEAGQWKGLPLWFVPSLI